MLVVINVWQKSFAAVQLVGVDIAEHVQHGTFSAILQSAVRGMDEVGTILVHLPEGLPPDFLVRLYAAVQVAFKLIPTFFMVVFGIEAMIWPPARMEASRWTYYFPRPVSCIKPALKSKKHTFKQCLGCARLRRRHETGADWPSSHVQLQRGFCIALHFISGGDDLCSLKLHVSAEDEQHSSLVCRHRIPLHCIAW